LKKKSVTIILSVVTYISLLPSLVFANTLLPDPLQEIFDMLGPEGSGSVQFIASRVQLALFIAIGLLVLVAVIYALISSFKYIRSQGDPNEIEQAQKAIKAIFFGLAAMMVAIIGIVLVFVFFGVSLPQTDVYQVCVSAPASVGCQRCKQDKTINTCIFCEEAYKSLSSRTIPDLNRDGTLDSKDILLLREINGVFGDGRNCIEPLAGGRQL
jgi:uncharacterized membrane protein